MIGITKEIFRIFEEKSDYELAENMIDISNRIINTYYNKKFITSLEKSLKNNKKLNIEQQMYMELITIQINSFAIIKKINLLTKDECDGIMKKLKISIEMPNEQNRGPPQYV
jgi:hypothetical protein